MRSGGWAGLSLRKKRWKLPDNIPAAAGNGVLSILVGRGIPQDGIAAYLKPELKNIPDARGWKDMDKAVQRTFEAVSRGETIALFGDYDVDGATSSAILFRYFEALGIPPITYVPDRMSEGYGPNAPAMRRLAEEKGAGLIFCLDSGTVAHGPIQAAVDAGADVIVLDHHTAEERLPPALAVVNPNRRDETGEMGHICAAEVCFFFVHALHRRLREEGLFIPRGAQKPSSGKIPEPSLASLLDLVAMGTICDVMPLRDVNRVLVANGLRVMDKLENEGIRALAHVTDIKPPFQAWHCGFIFGPHINAAGRIAHASLGVELLTTHDFDRALVLAKQLHELNEERKRLCETTLEQAANQIEARITNRIQEKVRSLDASTGQGEIARLEADDTGWSVMKCIIAHGDGTEVHDEGWHEGVIGIVAGRLKERYDRPSFCISWNKEGVGKASGRSVPGLDMGAAVLEAVERGILLKGGGHPMAAGLSVHRDRLTDFMVFFEEKCAHLDGGEAKVDMVITPGAVRPEQVDEFQAMEPFGMGNPEPRMAVINAIIDDVKIMKDVHIKLILKPFTGAANDITVDALMFNAVGSPLGEALRQGVGCRVEVLGKAKINEFRGKRSVQLMIEDARFENFYDHDLMHIQAPKPDTRLSDMRPANSRLAGPGLAGPGLAGPGC